MGLRAPSRSNESDGTNDYRRGDSGSDRQPFASNRPAQQYRDNRIHVCVSAEARWRHLVEEPDVGREPNQRSETDEVE